MDSFGKNKHFDTMCQGEALEMTVIINILTLRVINLPILVTRFL